MRHTSSRHVLFSCTLMTCAAADETDGGVWISQHVHTFPGGGQYTLEAPSTLRSACAALPAVLLLLAAVLCPSHSLCLLHLANLPGLVGLSQCLGVKLPIPLGES